MSGYLNLRRPLRTLAVDEAIDVGENFGSFPSSWHTEDGSTRIQFAMHPISDPRRAAGIRLGGEWMTMARVTMAGERTACTALRG
jgi:hypothetical protein